MKLWAIIPELIIAGSCLFYIPVAGHVKGKNLRIIFYLTLLSLIATLTFLLRMLNWEAFSIFKGTYAIDPFGTAFKVIIIAGAIITLLLLYVYFKDNTHIAHAPIALLFGTLGAIGVSSSLDLGLITLFLQMMSMAGYVLIVLIRRSKYSNEAGIKYFIYAATALAVMAFGLTFLYGLTGSLDIRIIGDALKGSENFWVAAALIMIIVGYGFEITLVPFHFWAPDVYEGTNAPIAGFLSVVPKVAGFAGLLRILLTAYQNNLANWDIVIAILAVVTMTLGNLIALRQSRMKRLLAYSSIAQSGYVLMALASAGSVIEASPAIGYYLLVYLFMNFSAFAVTVQIERNFGSENYILFRGLHKTSPWSAAVMALSLLSLAGIPPLAGFAGKVFVLKSVFDKGFTWLAIIGVINMTIGLFYYVSIIAEMYLKEPVNEIKPKGGSVYNILLFLTLAGTIILGVIPSTGLFLTNFLSEILLNPVL